LQHLLAYMFLFHYHYLAYCWGWLCRSAFADSLPSWLRVYWFWYMLIPAFFVQFYPYFLHMLRV
jgi:hypothetical protein